MRIYLFLWFVILCFSVFGKLVFDPSWSSNMQLVNQRLLRKCVLTFFLNFSASNARKVHQFAYSTHSLIEDWGLTTVRACLCKKKLYEPVWISWYMGTGMFSKLSKLHEPRASVVWELEWPYITKSMIDDTIFYI